MTPGTNVTVKCSYAELYDPSTGKRLFSLQGSVTGGYPFGTVSGQDGRYLLVDLNENCTRYLQDMQPNKTAPRTVKVKQVAIMPVSSDAPELPDRQDQKSISPIIWLLGAAIFALA